MSTLSRGWPAGAGRAGSQELLESESAMGCVIGSGVALGGYMYKYSKMFEEEIGFRAARDVGSRTLEWFWKMTEKYVQEYVSRHFLLAD